MVQVSRMADGTRKVTAISEITGMESDVITMQDIFVFDFAAGVDDDGRFRGSLRPTGVRPHFIQRLADQGVGVPAGLFADAR